MRWMNNIWTDVVDIFYSIPMFLQHLRNEMGKVKWYEWVMILSLLLRPLRFPGDENGAHIGSCYFDYSYHVLYYYLCSSIFECAAFYVAFRHRNLLLFLGLAYMGFCNIINQFTIYAVQWDTDWWMWIGFTLIFLYIKWKKDLNNGKHTE